MSLTKIQKDIDDGDTRQGEETVEGTGQKGTIYRQRKYLIRFRLKYLRGRKKPIIMSEY